MILRLHSDDSAGQASASIASGLGGLALGSRLAVVTLAQVVLQLVNNNCTTDDGVGPGQRDLCRRHG